MSDEKPYQPSYSYTSQYKWRAREFANEEQLDGEDFGFNFSGKGISRGDNVLIGPDWVLDIAYMTLAMGTGSWNVPEEYMVTVTPYRRDSSVPVTYTKR